MGAVVSARKKIVEKVQKAPGAERLVFKEVQVSALQTDFCSYSKRSLRRPGSKSWRCMVSKTWSWETLRVPICVPVARGPRSEIKGDRAAYGLRDFPR